MSKNSSEINLELPEEGWHPFEIAKVHFNY